MKLVQLKDLHITGRTPGLLFGLCAFSIGCCLVLGGGTRGGFLSDAILQFLTLPLLICALWHLFDLRADKALRRNEVRLALAFGLAILLLPLLQLVPLPPAIWTRLPQRHALEAVFHLIGDKPGWRPISVAPQATWLSALSLLPPLAIFVGTVLLGYRERRWLSLVVLAVGVVGVFLGLAQVSQGPSSPLRFFAFTNRGDAVGFFANRNHLAALLYTLVLFTAVWMVDSAFRLSASWERKVQSPSSMVNVVACFTVLVIVISAQAMTRSRAGVGLSIAAILGAFALAFAEPRMLAKSVRRMAAGISPMKLLVAAVCLALMFAVQLALYQVMEKFTLDPLEDGRIPIARNTFDAAKAYMPFGSGLGTFVPVYQTFEKPRDVLVNAYVNHAHDDVLELSLEAGIFGLALMALFAAWVIWRAVKVWRFRPGIRDIDQTLARAATLIIGLLVIHSFLDYPLRTGAMMAIMAFACALLVEPFGAAEDLETASETWRERMASPAVARAAKGPRSVGPADRPSRRGGSQDEPVRETPAPVLQPMELWGKDADWPEEWRGAAKDKPARNNGAAKPRKTPQG